MTVTRIDPRNIRRRLGLTQEQFWSMIGVTQCTGSRYERGWPIPIPVTALLVLVYGNGIAPLSGQLEGLNGVTVNANLDPKEIRFKLGASQLEFWSNIGMTQSAGSRYESGRAMPRTVKALLHLIKTYCPASIDPVGNRGVAADGSQGEKQGDCRIRVQPKDSRKDGRRSDLSQGGADR